MNYVILMQVTNSGIVGENIIKNVVLDKMISFTFSISEQYSKQFKLEIFINLME